MLVALGSHWHGGPCGPLAAPAATGLAAHDSESASRSSASGVSVGRHWQLQEEPEEKKEKEEEWPRDSEGDSEGDSENLKWQWQRWVGTGRSFSRTVGVPQRTRMPAVTHRDEWARVPDAPLECVWFTKAPLPVHA